MPQAVVARPPAQGISQLRVARVSGGSGQTTLGQCISEVRAQCISEPRVARMSQANVPGPPWGRAPP
eukprot:8801117-Pyramimonas_sp.AAC.1